MNVFQIATNLEIIKVFPHLCPGSKKIKIKVEWGIALPYLVPLTLIHYAICIAIQDSEHKSHLIS